MISNVLGINSACLNLAKPKDQEAPAAHFQCTLLLLAIAQHEKGLKRLVINNNMH